MRIVLINRVDGHEVIEGTPIASEMLEEIGEVMQRQNLGVVAACVGDYLQEERRKADSSMRPKLVLSL